MLFGNRLDFLDLLENVRDDAKGVQPSDWVQHAYPLQQVMVKLQGTRHSDKASIVGPLETVLARLKSGMSGQCHDDDFGYSFEYVQAAAGPSFFEQSAGES